MHARPTAALAFALVIALSAHTAHALTYTINFTLSSSGQVPTGIVTYANVGDSAPTSLSITDPNFGSTFTLADSISVTWDTQWQAGAPVYFSATGMNIWDNAGPPPVTLEALYFDAWSIPAGPGNWDNNVQYGTYAFAAVPEPATAVMVALGAVALGLKRRRTALR